MDAVAEPALRKMFKYKLKPTTSQVLLFERWLGLCRHLYNAALEERQTAWQRCHVTITCRQQIAELPELKRAVPELAEVNSQVLQAVINRLDRNFQGFVRRVCNGEKPGYPRFQSEKRFHSFTYPKCGEGGIYVQRGVLVLSKIGRVRFHQSRPLEGRPKTITILREPDGWYCVISCDQVPLKPQPLTGQMTGIDLGLKTFVTLADGSQILYPQFFRKSEQLLAKRNHRMRRRKEGSNRWKKAAKLVGLTYHKIACQRRDFQWKAARQLVRGYDVIYYERLTTANIMRNHNISKSVRDVAWSTFCLRLAFKAEEAGKRAVAVSPRSTSQVCSTCGVVVSKTLSVRWHSCPDCGASLDRDHNAAMNILRVGQTQDGQPCQALT